MESSCYELSNGYRNFVIITKNDRDKAYHALKNSVKPDNDFRPQHFLNPVFFVIFGNNHQVSVPIGKLMMRGFQNTPNLKS